MYAVVGVCGNIEEKRSTVGGLDAVNSRVYMHLADHNRATRQAQNTPNPTGFRVSSLANKATPPPRKTVRKISTDRPIAHPTTSALSKTFDNGWSQHHQILRLHEARQSQKSDTAAVLRRAKYSKFNLTERQQPGQ